MPASITRLLDCPVNTIMLSRILPLVWEGPLAVIHRATSLFSFRMLFKALLCCDANKKLDCLGCLCAILTIKNKLYTPAVSCLTFQL